MIVCGWPLSSKAKSSGPRPEIGFPELSVTTTSRLMSPCAESAASVSAHREAAHQRTNIEGRRLEIGRCSGRSLSRNLGLQKRKSFLFPSRLRKKSFGQESAKNKSRTIAPGAQEGSRVMVLCHQKYPQFRPEPTFSAAC